MPELADRGGYVAGERIADRYRLVRLLGEGGMGSVWVAEDTELDIEVAIKLVRSDIEVPAAVERLLTEARAAARLVHPSIVRVFDFGRTHRRDPFIVMELLSGESLADWLDREGRLSPERAVQLLLPVAEGLSVAHTHGVVHRDLKPDNIFIDDTTGRLQPKVIDFGVAKLDPTSTLTLAGTTVGSPEYMSPEQARGEPDVDQRGDIWALSVLLYECVAGRVPFEDPQYNALLCKIIEEPVKPIGELGVRDIELWSILERGLEKDRTLRWQTMRQLGQALARWLVARGVTEDVYGASLAATWLEPRPDSVTPRHSYVPSLATPITFPEAARTSTNPVHISVAPPATKGRWRAVGLALAAVGVVAAVALWALSRPAAPLPQLGSAQLAPESLGAERVQSLVPPRPRPSVSQPSPSAAPVPVHPVRRAEPRQVARKARPVRAQRVTSRAACPKPAASAPVESARPATSAAPRPSASSFSSDDLGF